MSQKKIQIKITEEGTIHAETLGIKGSECLEYISLLEELLEAQTVDSNYTKEYLETEIQIEMKSKQELKEK